MNFKKLIVLLIFISLLSVSVVSASDVSQQQLSGNDPIQANLHSNNVTMYYCNGSGVSAVLTDVNNTPISNQTVSITINNVTYNMTTDSAGFVLLPLGLNSGNYTADIKFFGGTKYTNASTQSFVQILPVIRGDDLTLYYKNGSSYQATFLDGQGNPLKNRNVQFNINGIFYTRKTNSLGVADLPIGLNPRSYVITAIHPDNNYMSSNIVTVLSNFNGSDITLYYKNGTNYTINVVDGQGNPAANQIVSLNVHGVIYKVLTDNNGVASLPIGLNPSEYIITASLASGLMYSNTITVLPVISGDDLTLYFNNGSSYQAKFLDGQGNPLKNRTVQMNVNGVLYDRVTDDKGVASLPIGLLPKTYIITSIHPDNGYMFSNTITVLSTVIAEDLNANYGDNITYSAKFLDGQGNPLNNTVVLFDLDGNYFNVTTDENGIASYNCTGLFYGVHDIIVGNDLRVHKHINVTYKTTVLGIKDYGYVIRYGPIGNLSSDVVIGYNIGLHPLEDGMHRAFKDMLFRSVDLKYQYVLYQIVVTKQVSSYEQGRMNGQLLASEFVLPDALSSNYTFFTDVHENWGNWASNEFIFCPLSGGEGEKIGRTIVSQLPFCDYYYPPNPTSHVYLTLPLNQAGIPAIFFEEYYYNSYNLKCDHAYKFIHVVDNLAF